jgi:hypothetical protein
LHAQIQAPASDRPVGLPVEFHASWYLWNYDASDLFQLGIFRSAMQAKRRMDRVELAAIHALWTLHDKKDHSDFQPSQP